jgi:hypothetical protein
MIFARHAYDMLRYLPLHDVPMIKGPPLLPPHKPRRFKRSQRQARK